MVRFFVVVLGSTLLLSRLAFAHLPGTCGDHAVQSPNNNGIAELCDDGHANGTAGSCCTADCQFKTAGAPCEDNDVCTTNMTCDGAGVCGGGQVVANCCLGDADCDNGIACDGVETCDLAATRCVAGAPVHCNDGDSCTDDHCEEPSGECSSTLVALDLTSPPTLVCNVQALVEGILGQ